MRFSIDRSQVIQETIDGESVIVNLKSGNYYSLDNVGACIWGFIENGSDLREIIEGVAGRYAGDLAEMENCIRSLLDELKKEDLIVSEQSTNDSSVKFGANDAVAGHNAERPGFEPPTLHKYTDMQDLLLLDPIHEVDEAGWPHARQDSSVLDK